MEMGPSRGARAPTRKNSRYRRLSRGVRFGKWSSRSDCRGARKTRLLNEECESSPEPAVKRRRGRGKSRHSSPLFPLWWHGRARSSPKTENADRAVLYVVRRFSAVIQAALAPPCRQYAATPANERPKPLIFGIIGPAPRRSGDQPRARPPARPPPGSPAARKPRSSGRGRSNLD